MVVNATEITKHARLRAEELLYIKLRRTFIGALILVIRHIHDHNDEVRLRGYCIECRRIMHKFSTTEA